MTISVKSRKQKGARLQQWVRDLLLKIHRSLEPDDVKSTSMGAGGEDVQLSPAARRVAPFSIECKNLANMVLFKWYDQAVVNTPKGSEPVVVAKANHRKPVVIVDAEYFFKMASQSKFRRKR